MTTNSSASDPSAAQSSDSSAALPAEQPSTPLLSALLGENTALTVLQDRKPTVV